MSFEKYVPDYEDKANAARMQKEAWDFGVNNKESADEAANSEVDIQKLRQEQQEQDKKREEVLRGAREKIAQIEQPQQQIAQEQASESLNVDMWPPISFEDDTSMLAQQNVGNTEGGRSLGTRAA